MANGANGGNPLDSTSIVSESDGFGFEVGATTHPSYRRSMKWPSSREFDIPIRPAVSTGPDGGHRTPALVSGSVG
jgi:hypothetical protein